MRAFILLISVFLLFGCQQERPGTKKTAEAIPVKVEKIMLRELSRSLEYAGDIKSQDEAIIYPKVSGKIIEKIKEEGAAVNKGDAIAYIDRDQVGLKFERAPVESTLSGLVGRIYVDIGANVSPQTPVALVVSMDKVKTSLDIPEAYLDKISLGQEAGITVDAYPREVFTGQITKISPVVNLANRAAPIEITINNSDLRLRSGMFAKVSLVIERRPRSAVVLKEAIIGRPPDTYVYVIENSKALMRKVSLGIHDGPLYEVTQGLSGGELVVVVGQQRLHEGAQVFVEMGNGEGEQK